MIKKIVSYLLIYSLILQLGCQSAFEISKENLISDMEYDDLTIITKDSVEHYFRKPVIKIENDSLIVNKKITGSYADLEDLKKSSMEKFALSDVDHFEIDQFDSIPIIIVVLGIGFYILVLGLTSDWRLFEKKP